MMIFFIVVPFGCGGKSIGNGKVELNRNEYMHWKPADWVYTHGMAKYFDMDSTGTLTVNDHGLFLIYAQVIIITHIMCTMRLPFI
jgi:hypothetical protein